MHTLCFGETMGLLLNPREERFRDCSHPILSFAGAESNTAIGLARLGCEVSWLSAVGDDPVGERIVRQLRAEGVRVNRVARSATHPTAFMLRERLPWSEPGVHYWRQGSAFSQLAADLALRWDWRGTDAVYLTGITPALGAPALAAVRTLMAAARREGARIWLDVNYRRKLWGEEAAAATLRSLAKEADILFASENEGRLLTGAEAPAEIGRALLEEGAVQVVLKLGAAGAQCFGREGSRSHPSFPIAAEIDPIGAGDAFNAGFISGVAAGAPVDECLRRGCACGAMACLADGDWEGLPTLGELERFAGRDRRADR